MFFQSKKKPHRLFSADQVYLIFNYRYGGGIATLSGSFVGLINHIKVGNVTSLLKLLYRKIHKYTSVKMLAENH